MASELPWSSGDAPSSIADYAPALVPILLRKYPAMRPDSPKWKDFVSEVARRCRTTPKEVASQAERWIRMNETEKRPKGDYDSLGYYILPAVALIRRSWKGLEVGPEAYLASRGLWPLLPHERSVVKSWPDLGYGFSIDKGGGRKVPVQFTRNSMIVCISDGRTMVGFQSLALSTNWTWAETVGGGTKDVKIRSTLLEGGKMSDASAVRLGVPKDGVLAVAEGVETAMSYTRLTGTVCWARLGGKNLGKFAPPEGVRKLIHVHDGDDEADRAYERLRGRWGGKMSVVFHKADEGDMNDMLKERLRGEG